MELRDEFAATARRLFADHADAATIEAAEQGRFPHALFKAFDDGGFGLALVPEAQGGLGTGLPEAAAILQAAGEQAVPGPVLESILGRALLAAAGEDDANGASGVEPLALGFAPSAGPGPVVVRGVGWARTAHRVLVVAPAEDGGGARLAILEEPGAALAAEIADCAGEPAARVEVPPGARWRPLDGGHDAAGWLRRAALLRGAQMVGALRWCLERTTAYTQERRQFGREIGKFQVVQQMMAEVASATVAAHAMLDAAVARPDEVALVAAARSRLGDAVDTVATLTHQVHGAIGFSYEYALQFRTRRLLAWRDQYGSVAHWRRTLAMGLVGRPADAIWPLLAD